MRRNDAEINNMASEYLKQKAQREVQAETPREPVALSRRDRVANWFHYHWYWLAIGAVLLIVTGTMLWNILGIGKTRPDYVFAYVGKNPLTEEQATAFEEAAAAVGADVNGDGKVKVTLNQYGTGRTGDAETALFYNQAADAKLLADITKGDSYFFLTDDPYHLQRSYGILANADGSEPDEYDFETDDKTVKLSDIFALSGLDPVFSDLYLGRRWYVEKEAGGHESDAALWELLTKGANP